MKRRDLFKGLLALGAGVLLPKPLRAEETTVKRTPPEVNDFRIVRTARNNNDLSAHITVTERWARGEYSFRIEDGPWISFPSGYPWVLFEPIPVPAHPWLTPEEARLAQTVAPRYLTAGAPALESLRKAMDSE
jgi:hypothetical protein